MSYEHKKAMEAAKMWLNAQHADLISENAALRADKERLDWLQNGGNAVDDVLYDMNVQIDFDVRAAIDAARKEAQP